jgi:hypothetical protein
MFHRSVAPFMFRPQAKPQPTVRPAWYPWDQVGIGFPTTYWDASDQSPSLGPFVTRYGLSWIPVTLDGGTLSLDTATWGNGRKLVKWNGGGASVRLGLRCDAFAPGVSNAKFLYTIAAPCYYQSGYTPQQQEFGYNGGASNNNAYWSFWGSKTPSLIVQIAGVNHILAAWNANSVNDPAVERRGIFVQTARVNGSDVEVQIKLRTSAGTYTSTPKIITSASAGNYSRFAQGYNPTLATANANSSGLMMGGGVGWKGVSATPAQMDTILDLWESLYPL